MSTYATPGPWANHAACKGATNLMTAPTRRDLKPPPNPDRPEGAAICTTCPVLSDCRQWALTLPDPAYGLIAGGLTPSQRMRIRRGLPATRPRHQRATA